jgi:formate dehydrogenase major subunit
VRACDEIRHTSAITLAGKGFSTRISFGAGGPIHESSCDFCGACIDVCPTATLLEHPHKWVSKPQRWVNTVCSYCSVGCTIKLGVLNGEGVIVRPSTINPFSNDQICVRGRYHYDALRKRDKLSRPLLRRAETLVPVSWDEALTVAAERLRAIVSQHGADAIGFLGWPLHTNEEAYLLQKLARLAVGTNNIDFSGGPLAAAIAAELREAFGTEALPADLTELAQAQTIIVVGDDLESSHPVASLRVKDAVVRNNARLIYVASRWGELVPFAATWVRPAAYGETAALAALAGGLLGDDDVRARIGTGAPEVPAAPAASTIEGLDDALAIARAAARDADHRVAVVFAPTPHGVRQNAALARAAIDLAILLAGPERAAHAFYYLPTDVNVAGVRDMGLGPDILPGRAAPGDRAAAARIAEAWGAPLPTTPGLDARAMLRAADTGQLKALVIVGDNPLLSMPDKVFVERGLTKLELLVVVDSVLTDTAQLAHIVLPDVDVYGKDGTYTTADRRVLRRFAATEPVGEARPALDILFGLAQRLTPERATAFTHTTADCVMDEIARVVPAYAHARYPELALGARAEDEGALPAARLLPLPAAPAADGASSDGRLALLTGRTLYTSLEAASLHRPDADKLHREEYVEVSIEDAARLDLEDEAPVTLANEHGRLTIRARVTDTVQPGSVFVSALYDGGAVTALLADDAADEAFPTVTLTRGA